MLKIARDLGVMPVAGLAIHHWICAGDGSILIPGRTSSSVLLLMGMGFPKTA
jgi:hypothetical protein